MYEWIFDRCEDEVCRFSCIQYTLHLRHSSGGLHTGNDFYISQSTRARVWCVLKEMNRLDASKCVFFLYCCLEGRMHRLSLIVLPFKGKVRVVCPLHSVLSRRERNPGRGDLLPVVQPSSRWRPPCEIRVKRLKIVQLESYSTPDPVFCQGVFLGRNITIFFIFFLFLQNKRSYKGTAQLSSTFKPKTFPAEWNLFSISIYFFPK